MTYPKTSDMERELVARLRESASGNARAMAATVVAVSDAAGAREMDALVDSLMGRRPARVLHLRSRNAGEFRSWSSARCALDRASRGVCFEDIFIESPDESAFEGRVWGPFVVRDLPALLLWTLGADRLLSSCGIDCAERVDLTIVDGSRDTAVLGHAPGQYRQEVLAAAEGTGALADLAWERSVSLRYGIARLFDGPYAADLDVLKHVRIRGVDTWTAGLVAGWLKDRLAGRAGAFTVDSAEDGATYPSVTFSLGGAKKDSGDLGISFIGTRQGRLVFSDGRTLELSFPDAGPGAILSRLVDAPVADPLYIGALRAFGPIE